jgi:small subunit ribosomal protein S10e
VLVSLNQLYDVWDINSFFFFAVGGDRENRGPRGDRGDYRRKEGVNGDFKPEFRGGLGKLLFFSRKFGVWD